jgi:hypothetical protein
MSVSSGLSAIGFSRIDAMFAKFAAVIRNSKCVGNDIVFEYNF